MALAGSVGSGGPLGTTNVGGGTFGGSGFGSAGGMFKTLFSGKPNAPIKPVKVGLPSRGDFGSPTAAPTVADPNRGAYGTPSAAGLAAAAGDARRANFNFNNPRQSSAFQQLMGLAQEQTGQQASEVARESRDAAQRRGYAGGSEDQARATQQDRMNALATAGFAGAESVRKAESDHYASAMGAFTQLQTSYNEAKQQGDIAFASDLTKTHIENAENMLKTAGLNMQQQLAYAGALNDAKQLQAKLDSDYNSQLIDNNKYISGQQQIAAQLLAQQMALAEKQREFNADNTFRNQQLEEDKRKFDLSLKANPGTALRTFDDPRYGGPKAGHTFTGLA